VALNNSLFSNDFNLFHLTYSVSQLSDIVCGQMHTGRLARLHVHFVYFGIPDDCSSTHIIQPTCSCLCLDYVNVSHVLHCGCQPVLFCWPFLPVMCGNDTYHSPLSDCQC